MGLAVGIVAMALMPGRGPGGFLGTALLGITGAVLANFVGHKAGWYSPGAPAGFFAAILGAIVLLLIGRVFFGRRTGA